jgi:hypothetical protein
MPRHVYTVCSRLASEDKLTSLVSLYHVIDELMVARPQPDQIAFPFIFRVTSVWMREDEDEEDHEYEYQVDLRLSHAAPLFVISTGRFHFNARFRRIAGDVLLQAAIPPEVMGTLDGQSMMFVNSSIRPVGAEAWQTYSYPISLICNVPPMDHANGNALGPPAPR